MLVEVERKETQKKEKTIKFKITKDNYKIKKFNLILYVYVNHFVFVKTLIRKNLIN